MSVCSSVVENTLHRNIPRSRKPYLMISQEKKYLLESVLDYARTNWKLEQPSTTQQNLPNTQFYAQIQGKWLRFILAIPVKVNTVKYFLFAFLFVGATVRAQCPTVVASCSNPCSSGPFQLNASTGFTTYVWSPASALSNPNIPNPIASSSGLYTVTATTLGSNLIINPDFSAGNFGFTSGQNYSSNYSPCNYDVGPLWFTINYNMLDHTPTTDNMFMSLDGCTSGPTIIWEEANLPVIPNTNYTFSFWASRADQIQPTFEMHFIGNASGNNILNTVAGIPYVGVFTWDQYGVPIWNSGSNTTLDIRIVNLQTNGYGNDFGLDDFSLQQFCVSTDSVQVTIASPPNIGPDTSICNNANIILNAGSANSYLWNTGDTTQNITVSAAGQYFVTTTIGNCTFADTMNVSIAPTPVVDLGPDTTLCTGTLQLDATSSPLSTYLWNTGDQTPTLLVDSIGTYYVTVSLFNCATTDSIHITVSPPVSLGNDVTLCGVNNPTLNAGISGSTYLWNTGATSQIINVNASGEYWVEVSNGTCVSRDTVEVSGSPGEGILFIPNTFTPNGNGVNEKFNAYGEGIISFHMQIFNRWGQLIFETNDINAGWDGTYKGKIVETDTYVYKIDYQTECGGMLTKNEIGHVNVIK